MMQLDDKIQEYYQAQFGKPATAAVLKQLKRDLFHAVWIFLMDDEFIHAYVHGLDGVERLSLPRFLIYSMDYPEKQVWFTYLLIHSDNHPRVLMGCLKYLGLCPCPECCLLKSKIHHLGSKLDMCARSRLLRIDSVDRRRKIDLARRLIFKGVNVTSQSIEQALGETSLVPTRVSTFQPTCTSHLLTHYYIIECLFRKAI